MTVAGQGGGKHSAVVWIDFNNNNIFEASEKVGGLTQNISGSGTYNFNITIPAGASTGNRKMRVLWQYNENADNYYDDKPYTTDAWGQTEDYTVNIIETATPTLTLGNPTTPIGASYVLAGSLKVPIHAFTITASGGGDTLTNFTFRTPMTSTYTTSEIVNFSLYANSSNDLSTATLVSTQLSPAAAGTAQSFPAFAYPILSGTRYFWITMNVAGTVTEGHTINVNASTATDMTTTATKAGAANASGVKTFTNSMAYCTATFSNSCTGDYINNFSTTGGSTNITNNNSGCNGNTNNYIYYPLQTVTQCSGGSFNISVQAGTNCAVQGFAIWIDWNKDGKFDGPGEYVWNSGSVGLDVYTGTITIPASTPENTTYRMRVMCRYYAVPAANEACATGLGWGEVEDYNVYVTPPVPMTYVSSTTTQNNTSSVEIGSTNNVILGIEVVTNGTLNPLKVTSFTLNANGTTDISDINASGSAKIYYTGTSSTFATSNLFGTKTPTIADFTITGSQTLEQGTNYFWLVYDVQPTAIEGHVIDAECSSITVGLSSKAPTVTAPAGNRPIALKCTYTFYMEDSGGDGWNGSHFEVMENGVWIGNFELTSGASGTATISIKDGANVEIVPKLYMSPEEVSFTLTTPRGQNIFHYHRLYSDNNYPIFNFTADCDKIYDFTVNHHAYASNTSNDCFIITKDRASQSGSIWNNYKIDLTQNFSISFDLWLGSKDAGADGVAFVLQGECTSKGGTGGGLGYEGINNSVIIEFDTYKNGAPYYDPVSGNDHIAIMKNGDPNHSGTNQLAAPVEVINLENNAWHPATVTWNYTSATSQTISLAFDGTNNIISYTGNMISILNSSQAFWGFTGSTGADYNLQQVCINQYPENTTMLQDTTIKPGGSVQAAVTPNASSYSWTPTTGVSNPNIYNPTFTPDATTTYTVTFEDACGNTITDMFTITVSNTLPVELISFYNICNSDEIILKWTTASETNNKYFTLERSFDLKNWESIAIIAGAGNSNSMRHYSYTDKASGVDVYYRLTQTDFDGRSETFMPIAANCQNEVTSIICYPNPFNDQLNIVANNIYSDEIEITVRSITGQIVTKQRISKDEISQNNFTLDLGSLSQGAYSIEFKAGNFIEIQKILKK